VMPVFVPHLKIEERKEKKGRKRISRKKER
jgi:hypothetical protein